MFNSIWQVWTLLWYGSQRGKESAPPLYWGFFSAEYSYTFKWNTFKRLAVGCLPAACCAESNVCADHKPSGCSAIFRLRIPCCRRTDRLGKSESFKNNSELKLSVWGRAASWGKLADLGLPISSLCRDGRWWSDMKGVSSFSHCCFPPLYRLAGREGAGRLSQNLLWDCRYPLGLTREMQSLKGTLKHSLHRYKPIL